MKNFRIKYYLLPLLFLVFLLFPFLNEEFEFIDRGESLEKRVLAEKPTLKYDSIDEFPSAYDAYLNDNFNLRNIYIKYHSYLNYKLFNKSSFPDQVVLGKQGWMFYNEGEFPADWQENLFSENEMQHFVKIMKSRDEYYKKLGADYYVFIVPDKQTVYSEFLPNWLDVEDADHKENKVDQLLKYYEDSTGLKNVFYLRQPLLEKKSEGLLYKKLDHHWNSLGSFYMSAYILDQISEKYPEIENVLNFDNFDLEFEEIPEGDLALMLGIGDLCSEILPKISPRAPKFEVENGKLRAYEPPKYFPYPQEYQKVMVSKDNALPKAVIIRDSFADYMLNQLSCGFGESIYIWDFWNYGLNSKIVEQEKPDIVINILVEKNIETLVFSRK